MKTRENQRKSKDIIGRTNNKETKGEEARGTALEGDNRKFCPWKRLNS
jgi:hypothetical protein